MPPFLSVVVPAYNESQRLPMTLRYIKRYLRMRNYASEIIVSDDGSTDNTVAVAEEKLKGFPHRILTAPKNMGKGHAVRTGMLEAQGEYVLFSDADLSTPIEEVERFLEKLQNGYDVVIASRALAESHLKKRQPLFREIMGRTFNLFCKLLAFKDIKDSQCGFKCFKKAVAQRIFREQKLNGFSFDVEVVYLAQKYGYRICELPVTWRNSPLSRVQVFTDPFKMFWDILKIHRLHAK